MRVIRVSYVAHWQSDRNRQPRHAASFLGDVAIREGCQKGDLFRLKQEMCRLRCVGEIAHRESSDHSGSPTPTPLSKSVSCTHIWARGVANGEFEA
jgi:hypothetical protein